MDANRYRKRLSLPPLLKRLLAHGQWQNPGDEILLKAIPFITDPLDFLPTLDEMLVNSGPLMGNDETENPNFHEYRGSCGISRDLPWIDAELTIYIAVNQRIGDDVGIALDYRPGPNCPRVIGGDWHSGNRLQYRLVSQTFADFAKLIGIVDDSENGG